MNAQHNVFENGFVNDLGLETRNTLLYSLGIMLLEIVYWRNWETLKQSSRHRDRASNLCRARKLLLSGCSEMRGRYDQIVKQLIDCDFRRGDDLSSRRLQIAVYQDVVCPLEKLAPGFKKLQISE